MELRHIRYFVAVAEELHFARAADRLGMEQSPLSRSIRELEAELKIGLFHRTTRRTWLTEAGRRFLVGAKRILSEVEVARASVRQASGERVPLRLGLTEHVAGEAFSRFLIDLAHHPLPIAVDLHEAVKPEIVRLVGDGYLDLGFLLEDRAANGVRCDRAWSEPLVMVLPAGHSMAEREQISIAEIAHARFVLPAPDHSPGLSGQLLRYLARHEVFPARAVHAVHQNSMVGLIAADAGIGIMTEPLTRGLTEVAVVPLSDTDAIVTTWMLYREGDASGALSAAIAVAGAVAGVFSATPA